MKYPVLVLKSGRDRPVLNQHPWVFSGAVKQWPVADDGDIVAIADNAGNLLAAGFYDSKSQISVRIFDSFQENIDYYSQAYWQKKFENALNIRKKYVTNKYTNTFRWVHAEGDFMPGIIADVYHQTVVLQLLVKGTDQLKNIFTKIILSMGFQNIYLKTKTGTHEIEDVQSESQWLAGNNPERNTIIENGLKFEIDIEKGQKTGFFIDQRENRQTLRNLCAGKSVLNTFAYSGGFSIYALAGKASKVVSVDISKEAIAKCIANVELNFGHQAPHEALAAECFNFLKSNAQNYDIIILDPPAFAKNARSVPNACRGYKELNMLGIKCVNPGGIVFTFSCSQNIDKKLFQQIVFSAAADVGRKVRILQHLIQPLDHPINIFHPESEYLKGMMLYVE